MMKTLKSLIIISALITVSISFYYLSKFEPIDRSKIIDHILVDKSDQKLYLMAIDNKVIKDYNIAYGRKEGKKQVQGDMKTPEGRYTINSKNPNSKYFLNLGINYPNSDDKKNANHIGRPVGGDIKIHGIMNGYGLKYLGILSTLINWTQGCIALNNQDMEELYNVVRIGTKIEIRK